MSNENAPAPSPAPAAPAPAPAPAAPAPAPAAPAAPAPAPAAPAAPAPAPAAPTPSPASAELAKLTGAPEKYELKDDTGKPLEGEHVTKFTDYARKLNLSNDAAGELLAMNRAVLKAQNDQVQAQIAEFYSDIGGTPDTWEAQLKADPQIGGDLLPANLGLISKVMSTFDSKGDLKRLFDKSKLGNHPYVARTLVAIGKAISEDKFVPTGSTPNTQAGDARTHFPNSQMNA